MSEPDAILDEEAPIILLDSAADLAALPAAEAGPTDTPEPACLAPAAQAYFTAAGITDPDTWQAFRLDAVTDADLARLLTMPQRRLPRPTGLWLPTCDPREPAQIVGLIRLTTAQHHHRFVTPPAGLAGDPAGWTGRRLILTDSPLQAMRLHQRGVTAVAVVDDPAVLPPLLDWLVGRDLIVAGFRAHIRAAIISALGHLGAQAMDLTLLPELDRSPAVTLAALGLGQVQAGAAVTPHLLRDLCAYAQGRIAAGAATAALQAVGITDPGCVAAWGIGYLPSEVRSVLSATQKAALLGRIYPDAVLVPAHDAQGVIVDALIVPADPTLPPVLSLHPTPQGLIAPAVSTAFPSVVIVDSLRLAAELYAAGTRQVVLLRNQADAAANAPRLAANGVRRAVLRLAHDQAAIAADLAAAGISVVEHLEEPTPAIPAETPPDDLVLVEHDRQAERARFQAGDLRIEAEVPWDARSLIGVRIQRGDAAHVDRLDLGAEAQRRRCAASAALRTGISAERITAHLAEVHDQIRDLAEAAAAAPQRAAPGTLTEAERTAALALARAPDLLDRLVADLTTCGWEGGDAASQRLVLLAALSRLTDEPVWVGVAGSGAASLDAIAAITPPEELLRVSRLSDSTFYQADPTALRHKLLLIDDAHRLSPGVATALTVLKRRGALSASRMLPDPVHGRPRTTVVEVHGPIAVCTATEPAVDPQLQPHLLEVGSEASPTQVAAALAARRRRCAQPGYAETRTRLATRLHHLQRILVPTPVIIPCAERISGFGTSPAARRAHDACLTLISAHALLHQHQRPILDGAVVASEADATVVMALMNERQAAQDAGLGRHAQHLLAAIWASGLTTVTMEDLARLLPDWTRYTFRAALDELVALDYLSSPRSGRGAARSYLLHGTPSASAPAARIGLRPVGELATVGESASPTPTRAVVNG
jgi:hypothetical protein